MKIKRLNTIITIRSIEKANSDLVSYQGTGTFIPKDPLIILNGRHIEVIVARPFIIVFNLFECSFKAFSTSLLYVFILKSTSFWALSNNIDEFFILPYKNLTIIYYLFVLKLTWPISYRNSCLVFKSILNNIIASIAIWLLLTKSSLSEMLKFKLRLFRA